MFNAERIYKILHEKNSVQRRLARATFDFWQQLGFHIVGDHFYDAVPNTNAIKKTYARGPRELAISVNWSSLASDANTLIGSHAEDYVKNRAAFGYVESNYYFYGIDALYYYSFIRERRPQRIIEIGQGFSTRIALAALAQNARTHETTPEMISIDPYSRLTLPTPKMVKYLVMKRPLQEIYKDISGMLADGDLLFVDSSHVFKFGSDVQLLFEYVYPRIVKNVSVHIHDIFSPFHYPLDWMVKRKQFWNEQYFLEAFLSFNTEFKIEAALHYLARDGAADRLLSEQDYGPDIVKREGASLYIRRTNGK
jgi:methyltransferase family protein